MMKGLTLMGESPMLFAVMLASGIGGTFQYGFHISVVNAPSLFIKGLVNNTCLMRYNVQVEPWQITLIWSFIISIFSIGGMLGTLCAGRLATAYGRKRCLLLNNLVAVIGATLMVTSKSAMSFEMIMVARFLNGINAGVGLSVHTLYLVECSPKVLRGMVGVSVATFVAMGKFTGQLLGLSELLGTGDRWPWLLAFSGFTGIVQLLILPLFPESPTYLLLERDDRPSCEKAIQKLWGKQFKGADAEIENMLLQRAAMQGVRVRGILELILDRDVRWQLVTILVTFTTLQFCGINAVYLYSLDVFREAGIPSHQLRYVALGTGLCEVTSSVVCGIVVESTGKKILLLRGYLAMSVTLGLLTIALNLQSKLFWMPYCSMILIFFFIFFFSTGPAGVTASMPGELFSQAYKSASMTIACFLNWLMLFLIGMVFPLIVEHLGPYCFIIFLGFCIFSALFVKFYVPETKNLSVLEISEAYKKIHFKLYKKQKTEVDEIQTVQTKF